jgi:uncharacterized protein
LGGGLALAVGTGVYLKNRRRFIPPEGKSRKHGSGSGDRPMYCQQCRNPMQKLDSTAIQPYLSKPEQVAQQLGSITFEGWQCSHCLPQLTETKIHIRTYILNSNRYTTCPTCQELTGERTHEILQHATEYSEGVRRTYEHCHCCGYESVQEELIPRIVRSNTISSSSSSSSSWSSDSSSSSSWGSSSSSSSGSDFGGGSSGGGGSGGSW